MSTWIVLAYAEVLTFVLRESTSKLTYCHRHEATYLYVLKGHERTIVNLRVLDKALRGPLPQRFRSQIGFFPGESCE